MWIKVTERLPKEKGFYNVKGLNNEGDPVNHTNKDKIWFTGAIWLIREGCKVTHWQEITPPKD